VRRNQARTIAKELQLEGCCEGRPVLFHGESMRPFLQEGDEVVVREVAWDSIRVGDMITYRAEDKFPTRRVIGRRGYELRLWCENWPDFTYEAARDDVLGRAVGRRRNGQWLTAKDPEWTAARRRALRAYRRRRLRAALGRLVALVVGR